jgi:hypothetical protein
MSHCDVRREGDEFACRCGRRWDVTDTDAPACPNDRRNGPAERRAPRTLAPFDDQVVALARTFRIGAPSTLAILEFAHAVRAIDREA